MAIEKFGSELLCLMTKKGIELGDLLTLGRQNFYLDRLDAVRISSFAGFEVSEFLEEEDFDSCYAEPFLARLGAKTISSVDYSDYEGSDFVYDLNLPIPESMENRFDVVYDGGTLEHLFNFPQAISNAMKMVKPGGHFLSCLPSNGFCGHGFYQISPELYFRLFSEDRGFKIRMIALGESIRGGRLFSIRDPRETGYRCGLNNGRPASLIFAAQRTRTIQQEVGFPAQAGYSATWADHESRDKETKRSSAQGIRALLKSVLPNRIIEMRSDLLLKRRDQERIRNAIQRIDTLEDVWQ